MCGGKTWYYGNVEKMRGQCMSLAEKYESVRILRAKSGKCPCKKPFCTGERCYRDRGLCRAWNIYNSYLKRKYDPLKELDH